MFVPVACLRCGKLFQVPPAAAGTDVPCPWCKEATPALPVAAVPPVPPPGPLSLDDAEPLPSPAPPPRRPMSPRSLVSLAIAVPLLAALTVAALGYRAGRVWSADWPAFPAPDGSFTAAFPGPPAGSKVEPNPDSLVTRGGEEFAFAGWYSGVRVWVGYQNLDPEWAKTAAVEPDGASAPQVLAAERDRRVRAAGGTVAKEGTIRTGDGRGIVVQIDTPNGKRVEHYLLALKGPRPRLYVVGVESPRLDPDGGLPARAFAGFRINP